MLLCVAGNIEERDPQSRALATHRQRPAWGGRGAAPLVRGPGSVLWLINKPQMSSRVCIANVLELFLLCLPAPCSRGVSLPHLLIPMCPFACAAIP